MLRNGIKKEGKNQLGITLVALVITVIILLILSGVAISMITGEGGLFARANHAGVVYNISAHNEADRFGELDTYATQYGYDEKSDLEKLREFFALGWEDIIWEDNETGEWEWGFNDDVEPIPDASTSIEIIGVWFSDLIIIYNENTYNVARDSMDVSIFSYDIDFNTFGVYNIEGIDVLITPSTPGNAIHTSFVIVEYNLNGYEGDTYQVDNGNGNSYYRVDNGEYLGMVLWR